ncbi:energy transducer TonB [Kozakia baliensis]|uniref:energy transducer TonB n=1 Tax=Kozakia baliensis TaxID=153496 RepID=UPI00068A5178|nr:energy transducer TonB [Kozakia baliensis]
MLFAPSNRAERTPPSMPSGREKLSNYMPGFPGYHRLRPNTVTLIKPQVMEDSGITTVLLASVIAHALLITMLLVESARHAHGTPQGMNEPQVEMMFAPPSRSGMEGPHTENPGGQTQPSPSHQESASKQSAQSEEKEEQEQQESRPTPATPTPEAPAAPPIAQMPSAELPTPTPEPKPVTPGTAPSGRSTTAHAHSRHASAHRHRATSNNPFANPMDLSFGEAPAPTRRRRGHYGGSGGPIDMSLGPLVSNGQINAPYQTRNSIRGVSDDYGSEIDHWIRSHMYYPEDAIRNGEDGPSSVHVVLDRSGRVKSVRLTGQSGSYSLDAATTGMFQGAKLPPVPPDMKGDHFDIDLTINYMLIRR